MEACLLCIDLLHARYLALTPLFASTMRSRQDVANGVGLRDVMITRINKLLKYTHIESEITWYMNDHSTVMNVLEMAYKFSILQVIV